MLSSSQGRHRWVDFAQVSTALWIPPLT